MGKSKKKNDEKKAALQARKEARADKAARKRLAKSQSKAGGGVDVEEDDEEEALDSLLEKYKRKDEEVSTTVLESMEGFPPPRGNASFTVTEDKDGHIYLFGGEFYDGIENVILGDLLRWDPSKNKNSEDEETKRDEDCFPSGGREAGAGTPVGAPVGAPSGTGSIGGAAAAGWKRILTPSPRPSPRCAHSTVFYKHYLYVFGGEFATAEEYHHYKDIWRFDTHSNKWEEIKPVNVGTPCSARSGHTAFVWKHYMILFGGFYEALRETRWFNDVCVLDLQTHAWMDIPHSKLATRPEARSACNVGIHGDMAIIQGGYSKLKNPTTKSEQKVHSDSWILHLKPLLQNKPPMWEKTSIRNQKSLGAPRSGTSSVTYKNRLLVYGGVVDEEQYHHKVQSVFYNDLLALDMDQRKWFPMRSKQPVEGIKKSRRRKKSCHANDEGGTRESEDSSRFGAEVENEDKDVDNDEECSDLEEIDPNEAPPSGWDLGLLRSNMFAFVDGNGNLVYEKIDDEVDQGENFHDNAKQNDNDCDRSNDNGKKVEVKKEDTAKEDEEGQHVGSEGMENDQKSQRNYSRVLKVEPRQSKILAASAVMQVNRATGVPEPVSRDEPLPRIKAGMVVRGNLLYVYGGLLEVGDREVTLDDCWTIDLRNRGKWGCLWNGTMHKQVWRGAVHDDDDSYVSTGADGEECDDDDDHGDDDSVENDSDDETEGHCTSAGDKRRGGSKQEISDLRSQLELTNENRTPSVGETMADFYARTSQYWTNEAVTQFSEADHDKEQLSKKELKREAFSLAQSRYNELRPVLDRLNELDIQQKEAETEKGKAKKTKTNTKSKKEKKERSV